MSVINATPLLAAAGGDYQISRSVRLRSSASGYFNRTLTTPTDNKKWTFSVWGKRGNLGSLNSIFGTQDDATASGNWTSIRFNAANQLEVFQITSGAYLFQIVTTRVFRDPSAFYNISVLYDSANATASERVKVYVNGEQVTAFATASYPALNTQTYLNQARIHYIGAYSAAPSSIFYTFDGYLTEINFIDGQALTPSSFGETDVITGVWKPKKYAGSYGTNGFYLNFADNSAATAAAIGKDNSGNGNNWTPNNISVTAGLTYDSMIDVPTLYADGGNGRGNYATLNPLNSFSTSVAPNEGNLRYRSDSSAWRSATSTLSMRQGKWYAEFSCSYIATGSAMAPGIVPSTTSFIGTTTTAFTFGYGWFNNGDTYALGTASASGTTYATNDVIGIAFDADAGKLWFSKNGVWIASGDPATGANARYSGITGEWCFALGSFVSHAQTASFANFGQRPFAYTPPTGFKALNTQNLPAPTILKGNQYFDATTYTGNGSTQNIVNAGGFQPDLVWMKTRSLAYSHGLYDSVRGVNLALRSDSTNAEQVYSSSSLTAFNSNGFTVGSYADVNPSGGAMVGWQWKESASAGFDIVTYTGNGSTQNIAHSLGVAPAMIIVKSRSVAATPWECYHRSLGQGTRIRLNETSASSADTSVWNNTAPTSSVFSIGNQGNVNTNTATQVAYLFAEVAGFSKFGSYTGNASADGPFVFCGFRPRFVMIKRTNTAASWYMLDTARGTYNVVNPYLIANGSNAEATDLSWDVLSNGFKLRSTYSEINGNGDTMIYAAFAEHPFKNSLAR